MTRRWRSLYAYDTDGGKSTVTVTLEVGAWPIFRYYEPPFRHFRHTELSRSNGKAEFNILNIRGKNERLF